MPQRFDYDIRRLNPELQQMYSALFDESVKSNEKDTTLSSQVNKLEQRCNEAILLLSEIIATLHLEGNQEYFVALPQGWHDLVKQWRVRYEKIKNEQTPD